MKHLLNNLTEGEKKDILSKYDGTLQVKIDKFTKLVESRLGDVKPYGGLIMEDSDPWSRYYPCTKNGIDKLFNKNEYFVEINKNTALFSNGRFYKTEGGRTWKGYWFCHPDNLGQIQFTQNENDPLRIRAQKEHFGDTPRSIEDAKEIRTGQMIYYEPYKTILKKYVKSSKALNEKYNKNNIDNEITYWKKFPESDITLGMIEILEDYDYALFEFFSVLSEKRFLEDSSKYRTRDEDIDYYIYNDYSFIYYPYLLQELIKFRNSRTYDVDVDGKFSGDIMEIGDIPPKNPANANTSPPNANTPPANANTPPPNANTPPQNANTSAAKKSNIRYRDCSNKKTYSFGCKDSRVDAQNQIKKLQKCLGIRNIDGVFGLETLNKLSDKKPELGGVANINDINDICG